MRDKLVTLTFFCVIMLCITSYITVYGPFAHKSKARFGRRLMIFAYIGSIVQVLLTFSAYLIYGHSIR